MATNKRMAAAKAKAKAKTAEEPKSAAPEANSEEKIMQDALAAVSKDGMSAGELVVLEKTRKDLIARAGFEYVDVRELTPNSNNAYAIDEGSIESLASLIFESKNTTPLIVRDVEGGREIVDGERRYRAHLLLGERYGDHWYMAPARVFKIGELSDEDALFMLHAENVGQRAMKPSERAMGVAAVSARIIERRKNDPNYAKGKATKEILAEQFGVSERTAQMETNIGRNLGTMGMEAYDQGIITKVGADAVAKLDEKDQEEIIGKVLSGEITKYEIPETARGVKPESTRIPRHADEDLKVARQALKRALKKGESPDRVIVAELRNLLDKLDPDKEA